MSKDENVNRYDGVVPNKLLGQHFLVSRSVLQKIIDAADLRPDDVVVEAGPGLGILTEALAARVKKVIAVEKDRALADALERRLRENNMRNVEIVAGDILKYRPFHRYKIVANLPYYLTSRFFRIFLEDQKQKPAEIIVMIQKEVAERIVAKSPQMNLLALGVQAYGVARIVAKVPRGAFQPPPKVESAILKITGISDNFFKKNGVSSKTFFAVARKAFSQKRKTLKHTLKPDDTVFAKLGISPTARPQELSPADWIRITKALIK